MTLTPLDQHDPRLRQVCAVVPRTALRDRQQQLEIEALLDFVYGASVKTAGTGGRRDRSQPNTVGLSANQVGIMKQICVLDLSIGRKGYTDIHVLVNPRVVWTSKARTEKPEGCVNFETVWGVTRRPRTVRVRAMDRSGNELELKLTGWPAALAQHEIDHLNGHLFIDRLEDPTHAHHVPLDQYAQYRRAKAREWDQFVDVSADVSAA
ncbi:MAG: def2 [Patescibacteria group bacterium]|nr:def2 [Patescibacteria group bacterium]